MAGPPSSGQSWDLRSAYKGSLARDGFLALPGLLPESAVVEVRELLQPLFAKHLPPSVRKFIRGTPAGEAGCNPAVELLRATRLEPGLLKSEAYQRCHDFASDLSGRSVGYSFDHAILKPANGSAVPLHQDQAYTGHSRSLRTLHFWIPLQRATQANGCISYIPGSHVRGQREHRSTALGEDVLVASDASGTGASVSCPLPVGGVTVHTPLTLHFTGPNRTSDPRAVWILHFGPHGRAAKLHPLILLEKIWSRASRLWS